MGRQITLYLLPSDTSLFEESLKKSLDISFFEYESPSSRPRPVASLGIPSMGESWLIIYLTLPNQAKNIVCEKVPSQGYWTIDSLRSPVVEFSRCYFNGKVLREGRLFYDSGYYDDSGTWVEKPKDFLEWADKLFRITKKVLKKIPNKQEYAGQDALAWLEKKTK